MQIHGPTEVVHDIKVIGRYGNSAAGLKFHDSITIVLQSREDAQKLIAAAVEAERFLPGEPDLLSRGECTGRRDCRCGHGYHASPLMPQTAPGLEPPGQAAPLDSESWTCGGCHGTFIGRRPAGDRCPACQPAADADGYLAPLPDDPPHSIGAAPFCGAWAGNFSCTAILHSGGNHVAYNPEGRVCNRWPATVPADTGSVTVMTGPEHYAEAERLLAIAAFYPANNDETCPAAMQTITEAQVHATLALAAAMTHAHPTSEWYSAMGVPTGGAS